MTEPFFSQMARLRPTTSRHQDAMRIASKELLKDLWRASRNYYETEGLTHD